MILAVRAHTGSLIDQFRGNADRDLLRGLRADGQTDGQMHAVDLCVGKAVPAKKIAHDAKLFPAPETADIPRRTGERLPQYLKIRSMAGRHDDDIILRRDGHIVRDSFERAAHAAHTGKARRVQQLTAAVEYGDAEADAP